MLYQQIIRSFEALMHDAVPIAWRTRQTREQQREVLDRHHALAQAIANRDPAGARALMDAHFDTSIADVISREAVRGQGRE